MAFFSMQYRVLFHDTMAYGSQHHMTNIKLQNLARETVLFGAQTPDQPPWQEQLADIVMLTREAYSLNLAAVNLGERVGILMTYEAPTRSTVRLCFRLIHEDGTPVACGYQTMILMHRTSGALVTPPPLLSRFLDANEQHNLLETLVEPSFAERLHSGAKGLKDIMSEPVRALGRRTASAAAKTAYPKIVDLAGREQRLEAVLV